MRSTKTWIRRVLFLVLFTAVISPSFSVHAEPAVLKSDDANWIANMIFQNECQMKDDNLISWNEGEDFMSLGIGHFIWYPHGRSDRYRESFPELIRELQADGIKISEELLALIQKGPPWKNRDEFLSARTGREAVLLRDFLKQTMSGQAMFMIRRFQKALLKMIQTTPAAKRALLTEKIFTLMQTRNGLYAMIDYLNFKGDGLSPSERYREHGWGLFQVFYEMGWPVDSDGPEAEFVEAARIVLRRRVDNAPSERQEERWILGWENRVKSYSDATATFTGNLKKPNAVVISNNAEAFEILNTHEFSART